MAGAEAQCVVGVGAVQQQHILQQDADTGGMILICWLEIRPKRFNRNVSVIITSMVARTFSRVCWCLNSQVSKGVVGRKHGCCADGARDGAHSGGNTDELNLHTGGGKRARVITRPPHLHQEHSCYDHHYHLWGVAAPDACVACTRQDHRCFDCGCVDGGHHGFGCGCGGGDDPGCDCGSDGGGHGFDCGSGSDGAPCDDHGCDCGCGTCSQVVKAKERWSVGIAV